MPRWHDRLPAIRDRQVAVGSKLDEGQTAMEVREAGWGGLSIRAQVKLRAFVLLPLYKTRLRLGCEAIE